jgi:multidrug efflux pump subunit AcrB
VVRVGDVADIRDGYEDARVMARIDGRPAVAFAVIKDSDADVIRTTDAVMALADRFDDELPEGAEIVTTNDQSYYVRNRFDVVLTNGAIGLALVLVVLTVFLNLRTAFWVAIGIPVVLLGVVFMLPLFGRYLDIITLASMLLVIGLIVDDAIIVSENTVRRHAAGAGSGAEAAAEGIAEVFRPVLTTLLTTFLAFAPLFFMPGLTGQFIVVIPLAISLALLMSLLEITFALPAHLAGGLDRLGHGRRSARAWFTPLRRVFLRLVRGVLRLRYLFVALSLALLAGSLWYASTSMRFILFPGTGADSFVIYVDLPVGSSLEHTSGRVRAIEDLVAELPDGELSSFATRIGSHGRLEPGENDHWALVEVNLTPYRARDRTAEAIVADLRDQTDDLVGFRDIFYKVNKGGPPLGRPVTIRVVGHDPERRRALADSVVSLLRATEGVHDLDRNDRRGPAQVRVALDQTRLARRGLTTAQVAGTLRLAYEGREVTSVRWDREDVALRVQLTAAARRDSTQLARLLVPNAAGRLVRLGDVATFTQVGGPARIYRHDTERATMITADTDAEVITPLQAVQRVRDHFDLERNWPGLRFRIGGEAEETQESFRSLFVAFGVAVVAIYFLLMLLFESVTQPLVIMVAIPFGVVAVIIAFALHGLPLGFLGMLGLVGLTGVVVNDSLVMVSHIEDLRRRDPDSPLTEHVSTGAANRLRPVTMTTLTTSCGLLPLAYGLGGSDPFLAPMALSLGMGLLFATPLTLLLVPSLYLVRDDVHRLGRWARRRLRPGHDD